MGRTRRLHEAIRNAYKTLVGKPEENRPLGRHKHRWKDNIKSNLKETGYGLGSFGLG
jgi:hypothetical protein